MELFKVRLSILILFLVLEVFCLNDDDEECGKMFKSQTQPRNCCNYPLRFILPVHQEKCKKSCDMVKDRSGGCCALDCIYHKTGVVRNFILDPTALLELYENYLNEKGGGKFDQWMPVVDNSIKTCTNLVPISEDIFTCNIPQYALDIMDCVSHFNFHNCPNFKNSSECETLKKFVGKLEKCGKTINGTFIINYQFFEK